MIQKQKPYRSKRWLHAVHDVEQCVLCGAHGVQAAHRNVGKGMGMKVDDSLCAALCPTCHHEIDNAPNLTREQRRAMMDDAICRTLAQLTRMGKVVAL